MIWFKVVFLKKKPVGLSQTTIPPVANITKASQVLIIGFGFLTSARETPEFHY